MSNDPRVGSINVLLVLKVPKISIKAHFTLRVKAKVELELNIPIGAITEISPKGFTLGVKAKNIYTFLIYHFMVLTCPNFNSWGQCCCKKKLFF
jgi:hypothetical protein